MSVCIISVEHRSAIELHDVNNGFFVEQKVLSTKGNLKTSRFRLSPFERNRKDS